MVIKEGKTEAKKTPGKKLVKKRPPVSLENVSSGGMPKGSTNKVLTRVNTSNRAAPHLRKHEVKGHTYYSYVRGTDQEIYLGSADIILKAVQEYRQRQQIKG